jgi:hypothetical protein
MRISVAKRYSIQKSLTRETITTARAPVAPDIMPGRPPNIAASNPTINAACNQTRGFTPATNENAIASGTRASATVSPESISVLTWFLSDNSLNHPVFCIYDKSNMKLFD